MNRPGRSKACRLLRGNFTALSSDLRQQSLVPGHCGLGPRLNQTGSPADDPSMDRLTSMTPSSVSMQLRAVEDQPDFQILGIERGIRCHLPTKATFVDEAISWMDATADDVCPALCVEIQAGNF